MNYKKLLVYAPTKAIFEQALANSIADQNSVAYIEEPRMIWAQGNYYPCPYTKEEIDQLVQNNKDEFERIIAELKGNVTEEYNTLEKIENKIKEEVLRAQQKESELDTKIEAETNRAQEAENNLDQKLDQEIERAKSAESTLNQQITDEVNRAREAEQTLTEGFNDANESIQDVRDTYLPLAGGTMSGSITFESIDINGHEYVDLGLPSGNLWAKYNIGATSEEEAGLYFQWGDTQGYTAGQIGREEGLKEFLWSDYKFSTDGSSKNFSKYNASDNKTVLDPEDDAAHVNMGGNWRMPTFEECKELFMNTDIYLVQTDGKEIHGTGSQNDDSGYVIRWDERPSFSAIFKGIKLYKKGDKQTYLFVPAGGFVTIGTVAGVNNNGSLQSASLNSQYVGYAWRTGFTSLSGDVTFIERYSGYPVRGVCPKSYIGNIITVSGKTSTDLLNAAGGTTSISDLASKYVTLDTTQNITGKKVFNQGIQITSNVTESTPDDITVGSDLRNLANRVIHVPTAESDHFILYTGGSSDNGFTVLATGDNGDSTSEPIFITQCSGVDDTISRLITLMDNNGNQKFNNVTATGYTISGKTANDLLTAAGSTTVLKTIGGESLLGEGNIELATDEDIEALFI